MQSPSEQQQQSLHPKISVESKKDILYLKNEILKFAKNLISDSADKISEVEISEKLEKWVEMTFEMASDSIEINGMSYNDAFEIEQEYEPLNEQLRQQADELQTKIQDTLVALSGFRKSMPTQLEQLDSETLQIDSKSAENAIFESDGTESEIPVAALESVALDNYNHLCQQQKNLSMVLPETLKKAQDIENLLDDLKIPPLGSKEKSREELEKQSRRRSSLGKTLLSANYLNASISAAHHPQKAAEALVKRLEMESRKKI